MDVDDAAAELSVPARLVQALLSGVGERLTACELGALAVTCTEVAAAAANTPEYWSFFDLTPIADAPAFLESSLVHSSRFAAVVSLTIQFCPELRDAHLEALPPWALKTLHLDACHGLTDAGVKAVVKRCGKGLQSLSLYWNNAFTKAAALAVSLRCPDLRTVSFSGCGLISSAGLLALAARCSKLQRIDLTRLLRVDDVALAALTQANTDLRELRLFAASQYSDPPIISVATHCPRLQLLDCTGLSQLTDASIVPLGERCPQLHTLNLSWCKQVGDAGVCAVARGCRLRLLSVHGNPNVTAASRAALAQYCAHTLQSIDVRGCVNMPRTHPEELLADLPRLRIFVLHT